MHRGLSVVRPSTNAPTSKKILPTLVLKSDLVRVNGLARYVGCFPEFLNPISRKSLLYLILHSTGHFLLNGCEVPGSTDLAVSHQTIPERVYR